jgi:hypothetical protein
MVSTAKVGNNLLKFPLGLVEGTRKDQVYRCSWVLLSINGIGGQQHAVIFMGPEIGWKEDVLVVLQV